LLFSTAIPLAEQEGLEQPARPCVEIGTAYIGPNFAVTGTNALRGWLDLPQGPMPCPTPPIIVPVPRRPRDAANAAARLPWHSAKSEFRTAAARSAFRNARRGCGHDGRYNRIRRTEGPGDADRPTQHSHMRSSWTTRFSRGRTFRPAWSTDYFNRAASGPC
jgi:hypothetical protein